MAAHDLEGSAALPAAQAMLTAQRACAALQRDAGVVQQPASDVSRTVSNCTTYCEKSRLGHSELPFDPVGKTVAKGRSSSRSGLNPEPSQNSRARRPARPYSSLRTFFFREHAGRPQILTVTLFVFACGVRSCFCKNWALNFLFDDHYFLA